MKLSIPLCNYFLLRIIFQFLGGFNVYFYSTDFFRKICRSEKWRRDRMKSRNILKKYLAVQSYITKNNDLTHHQAFFIYPFTTPSQKPYFPSIFTLDKRKTLRSLQLEAHTLSCSSVKNSPQIKVVFPHPPPTPVYSNISYRLAKSQLSTVMIWHFQQVLAWQRRASERREGCTVIFPPLLV